MSREVYNVKSGDNQNLQTAVWESLFSLQFAIFPCMGMTSNILKAVERQARLLPSYAIKGNGGRF